MHRNLITAALLAAALPAGGEMLPAQWRIYQWIKVEKPGLVELDLDLRHLDAAHPSLKDLRLRDASGREVPFFTERPRRRRSETRPAKRHTAAIQRRRSIVTLETGAREPIEAVLLKTPETGFIKSATVVDRSPGARGKVLAEGRPVFRRGGVAGLEIAVPKGVYERLEIAFDDERDRPFPVTGASVRTAEGEDPRSQAVPLDIVRREDFPGETLLTLRLPAKGLAVQRVRLAPAEPIFSRQAALMTRVLDGPEIRRSEIAAGRLRRVPRDGAPPEEALSIRVESVLKDKELTLRIDNGDGPPLSVESVTADIVPARLRFYAAAPGEFVLVSGNPSAPAAAFDLAALGDRITRAPKGRAAPGPVKDNPAFREARVLPELDPPGAAIDPERWKHRAAVRPGGNGVQSLALTPHALAHSQASGGDLRLAAGGRQVPYILDRTGPLGELVPEVSPLVSEPGERRSRWALVLPENNLPIASVSCRVEEALFTRNITVFEEVPDRRGRKRKSVLGAARWVSDPDAKTRGTLAVRLNRTPRTNTLILEIEDGDNPAISPDGFKVYYRTSRLLFKAPGSDEIVLYYGNPAAARPVYDISLLRPKLLEARTQTAVLDEVETKKPPLWKREAPTPLVEGFFWAALAAVVAGLLSLIKGLLPSPSIPH